MRTFKRALKRADNKMRKAHCEWEKRRLSHVMACYNYGHSRRIYNDLMNDRMAGNGVTMDETDVAGKVATENFHLRDGARIDCFFAKSNYDKDWIRHFWLKRTLGAMKRHLELDKKSKLGVRAMMAQRLRARHAAALPGGFRHAAALRRGGSAA